MTGDDHHELIDEVFGLVIVKMAMDGVGFMVLTINEQGQRGRIILDPCFLENAETKDVLTEELRRSFRENGVVRYVLVAECWMDRKTAPGAVSSDRVSEFLAKYAEDYERRGLSPEHGGGREEIIFIHVCDRKRSTVRVWTIDRDPITGAVRDLIPFEADPGVILAGRLAKLLEDDAN